MKVGIIGSRRRTDKEAIEAFVDSLPQTDTIISGHCRGPDLWAETRAKERGMQTIIFKPDLSNTTNRIMMINAYYARNKQIAEECEVLVAFPAPDRKGGTENTIKFAEMLNKRIILK
jgi:predicted Rossmann fold nucleotide-binding protein DprA/Smf involved in DNA uptake